MNTYRYQFVLQFPTSEVADFDNLVAFEERLIAQLGSTAKIDGHDFGSGELNIFLLMDDPVQTAEGAEALRQLAVPAHIPVVAYRELIGDTYIVLSLPGYSGFSDLLMVICP